MAGGEDGLLEQEELKLLDDEELKEALFRSCQQRRQYIAALQRLRGPRNEGPSFLTETIFLQRPPAFSNQDLDMRRKAEILRYNGASTQGGVLPTKSQHFARLTKYPSNAARLTNLDQQCLLNNRFNIPTPTSSCNVPGPIQNLVYDPEVPLSFLLGKNVNSRQNVFVSDTDALTFDELPSELNASVMTYDESVKKTRDFLAPLSISSITFFRNYTVLRPPVLFALGATVAFTVTQQTPSAAKLRLIFGGLQPVVYLFTEPQRFEESFVIQKGNPLLEEYSADVAVPTTPGSYEMVGVFPVQAVPFSIAGSAQQTVRLAVNFSFSLMALDSFGKQVAETNLANIFVRFYRGM